MDPLGHWSVGALCGLVISLPLLTQLEVYDYIRQRWQAVKWSATRWVGGSSGPARRLVSARTGRAVTRASPTLIPLLRSRYAIHSLVIATVCGFIAMLPDTGALVGEQWDRGLPAYLCFAHPAFDAGGVIGPVIPSWFLFVCWVCAAIGLNLVAIMQTSTLQTPPCEPGAC